MTVEYRDVLLEVRGAGLRLGTTPILRDVHLEVRDLVRPGCITGQVVGLLGPSGMGKTQLFRLLAGLQAPTSGEVRLNAGQPVRAGAVGVVAQDCPLFEHRTVLGNLEVAAAQAGLGPTEGRAKALTLLRRFGLEHLKGAWPARLSGGQRQRVAIAQQALCSEHFLLMDEPFSGLDPLAVDEVCRLIGELASAHELNTIIVVTHDIEAAVAVSDHLWLLGRDRDEAGRPIPGARVQATYDLVERGIAFQGDTRANPAARALVAEVRERFRTL